MDGTYQSLPYILASVIASDSALCVTLGVYLCEYEFVDGVLYAYVLFCYDFEQSSSGSLSQGASMSYVSQCLAQGPVTRAGLAERAEKP